MSRTLREEYWSMVELAFLVFDVEKAPNSSLVSSL